MMLTRAAPMAALYSSGLTNVAVPLRTMRKISFDARRCRKRRSLKAEDGRSVSIRLCDFGSLRLTSDIASGSLDYLLLAGVTLCEGAPGCCIDVIEGKRSVDFAVP